MQDFGLILGNFISFVNISRKTSDLEFYIHVDHILGNYYPLLYSIRNNDQILIVVEVNLIKIR